MLTRGAVAVLFVLMIEFSSVDGVVTVPVSAVFGGACGLAYVNQGNIRI